MLAGFLCSKKTVSPASTTLAINTITTVSYTHLVADVLSKETDTIINLASKEYSKVVSDNIGNNINFITCSFAQIINGKPVEKGTLCKMARGEMVRYMAENNVKDYKNIKNFKMCIRDRNIAIRTPVTSEPAISPPSALVPRITPTIIGAATAITPGTSISLRAAFVDIATQLL